MVSARALLLLASAAVVGQATGEVVITDNGYSGLVVGISQDVPESQGQQLIDAVKVMLSLASPVLYKATGNRAYFKQVTIVIPMSWTNITTDREGYSEVYEDAEVRVAPANPSFGDGPYTLQPGGCGDPGQYIHVTPGYLTNLNTTSAYTYGPAGKALTHEWAHLRYGVFEEYGYPGDPVYPLFFYKQNEQNEPELKPNTCTNVPLKGYKMDYTTGGDCTYNVTTGLPNSNCYFYPYEDTNDAISSLMSFTFLSSVTHFCNCSKDKQHEPQAPNKQNYRCNQQSVWEVMLQNADFSHGSNPPSNLEPDQLVPTFEVVRPAQAYFVMVLDTSGSMQATNSSTHADSATERIKKLHSSATKWIKYELQNGTWVSIITFNTDATLQTDFKQIVDESSRNKIASYVPTKATGGTCICNGVSMGLKTLHQKLKGTGGIMVLMTDGVESSSCINPDTSKEWDMTDLYDPVVAAKVRVITMAFGTSADARLEKFASISGGSTYFIDDKKAMLDLDQAFQGCLTYQPDITVVTEKDILLFQQHFAGSTVKTFSSMFSIDPTTGRDFVFKLEYDDAATQSDISQVQLVSPSGEIFNNISYVQNENFGTLKLGLAEEGDWMFSIKFHTSQSSDVVVTVTSKARTSEVVPLTVECWIGTSEDVSVTTDTRLAVLGKVRQGNNAVLHATVMAHVTTPSSSSGVVDMQLLDNGVGADGVGFDGIYSKYFTEFSAKGRYSVVCEVRNDGSAVINEGFSASGVAPSPSKAAGGWCCGSRSPIGNTRPTGNFTRTMSAGAFQVLNQPAAGLLPPAQVSDLLVQQRGRDSGQATVTWTAPGDDLDQGTARQYMFKWSNASSDLSPANFAGHGQEVNSSWVPAPAESGTVQSLTLQLPRGHDTLFLAMKTKDTNGHWSTVSNTAILYLGAVPPPPEDGGLSGGAIAGIIIAALVVIVVVAVGGLFMRQRRRRSQVVTTS